MIDILTSILAIDSNAKCSIRNEDIDNIRWTTTPIAKADILGKQAELQAEYDALDYARKRKVAYPPLKEFAEAYTEKEFGADSTKMDAYKIKYEKVRSDNPK